MAEGPQTPAGGASALNPALVDQAELLDTLAKDFDRLKRQKARPTGGVEGSTLTNLCFLHDEQYVTYQRSVLSLEAKDANKLYLTFNLIFPRFQKLLGRLSAFNAPFKARPNRKDPQSMHEAEIVDRLLVALDEKLDEPSRLRERLHWMGVGGTSFEYIPWVPNATIEPNPQFDEQTGELLYRLKQTGEIAPESMVQALVESGEYPQEAFEPYEEVEFVGEVGSEILGPFNVFLDSSVRSVADLAPDQWVHIAKIRTLGWVKENFDAEVDAKTDISLVSSRIDAGQADASGAVYLKDLIPLVQGSADDTDPPMTLVVESYQPPSRERPRGRYVVWIPDDRILHDAENPYEEIPLVDFHFGPVTTSFWTKAYISPLIAPQRFINKRLSQLGEQSNATLYSDLLLGPGLSAKDINADQPGVVENGVNEQGIPMVQRRPAPEIPQWFLQSIDLAVKMFNDAAGGADLMEDHKFPGQLRGPNAVPMLQEIMDTQWGPLFAHLGERIARVKQMRLNRVKQFYPPLRTMHYTDKTQKDEVLTFHTEKVLRAGTNFSVTVERGAMIPELRALREARIRERLQSPLAILYTDDRTGKIDKGKVAADLQFGDIGREARESTYRKLAQELIKMIWDAQAIPPVQPFYDHAVMLDELEAAMATTEFLRASPQVQQAFGARWQQHSQFLQQEAERREASLQDQMVKSATAQAVQQAAAQAASETTEVLGEVIRQGGGMPPQPSQGFAAAAGSQAEAVRGPRPVPRPEGQSRTRPGPGRPGPQGGGLR